jgi:hypothetical protein
MVGSTPIILFDVRLTYNDDGVLSAVECHNYDYLLVVLKDFRDRLLKCSSLQVMRRCLQTDVMIIDRPS